MWHWAYFMTARNALSCGRMYIIYIRTYTIFIHKVKTCTDKVVMRIVFTRKPFYAYFFIACIYFVRIFMFTPVEPYYFYLMGNCLIHFNMYVIPKETSKWFNLPFSSFLYSHFIQTKIQSFVWLHNEKKIAWFWSWYQLILIKKFI